MKSILSILALVAMVATVANANYLCGDGACGVNQVCFWKYGQPHCALLAECESIAIIQTKEKTWVDNGCEYSLFRVHITNYGNVPIRNIHIGTDCTLEIKDNQLWNINFDHYRGVFSLPSYTNGLPCQSAHLFGYVVKGHTAPNMIIRGVEF